MPDNLLPRILGDLVRLHWPVGVKDILQPRYPPLFFVSLLLEIALPRLVVLRAMLRIVRMLQ